jgi:hypothetical protein
MRSKQLTVIAFVGVAIAAAIAVQQSPNFSSLSTQVRIVTSDSTSAHRVTLPLPYREPRRVVRPPVGANQFDTVWPLSGRQIGDRTDLAPEG